MRHDLHAVDLAQLLHMEPVIPEVRGRRIVVLIDAEMNLDTKGGLLLSVDVAEGLDVLVGERALDVVCWLSQRCRRPDRSGLRRKDETGVRFDFCCTPKRRIPARALPDAEDSSIWLRRYVSYERAHFIEAVGDAAYPSRVPVELGITEEQAIEALPLGEIFEIETFVETTEAHHEDVRAPSCHQVVAGVHIGTDCISLARPRAVSAVTRPYRRTHKRDWAPPGKRGPSQVH